MVFEVQAVSLPVFLTQIWNEFMGRTHFVYDWKLGCETSPNDDVSVWDWVPGQGQKLGLLVLSSLIFII